MTTTEEILLRREYAGLAMQGLLADHKDHEDERTVKIINRRPMITRMETCPEAVARLAVEHADALIARLKDSNG